MPLLKGAPRRLRRSVGEFAGLLSRHWPLPRGRDRLALIAAGLGALPEPLDTVVSALGHHVTIDPSVFFYRHAYFTGIYEPGISLLLKCLVARRSVCADIGANIGWHSLAIASMAGPDGRVHAFEPFPANFERLQGNTAANGLADVIIANQLAVADRAGTCQIHVEDGQPATHASLGIGARDGTTAMVETVALDDYRAGVLRDGVDLIKVDVEGAERLVLAGAHRILASPLAPALVIEAAEATARPFGYAPNDLLDDLEKLNAFRFFVIDDARGVLTPLERFPPGHIGANILALPAGRTEELSRLKTARLLAH